MEGVAMTKPLKLPAIIGLAAAFAVLLAAIASAAIPSAGGTISACKKADGSIRLIDKEAGQGCPSSQQLVEWNRQGPAGPEGPVDPAAGAFLDRFGADVGGAAAAAGAPCTVGQVLLTASGVKTAGGVSANGQLLEISQYDQLFSLLGTTYGGDGKVAFAVPDLRAITPDHMTYSICTHGVWPTS
jgi:Phage Tail Collar Domain